MISRVAAALTCVRGDCWTSGCLSVAARPWIVLERPELPYVQMLFRDCGHSLLNGLSVSQIQRGVCAGGCIGVMSAKTPRQSLRRWHRDCMSVSGLWREPKRCCGIIYCNILYIYAYITRSYAYMHNYITISYICIYCTDISLYINIIIYI